MKLPTFENPLKLFTPAFAGPANAASGMNGGHMMFASSGSGSGGGNDDYGYDDDYSFDDEPPQDEPPGRRPQSNRTRRSAGAANATGGRSRTASVEPEGRYWTDYLRIALPVIGIILMLGLLWIWASSLLGGDDQEVDPNEEDTIGLVQTETPDPNFVNTEPNAASTPGSLPGQTNAGEIPISGQTTPAVTQPPAENTEPNAPEQGGDNQTGEEAADAGAGEEAADAGAGEEAPADGEITIDARVRITGELNVRPSAGTSGDPLWVSEIGDEGTVISGPEEADGYVWWELVFDDGSQGFVIEDELEVVP